MDSFLSKKSNEIGDQASLYWGKNRSKLRTLWFLESMKFLNVSRFCYCLSVDIALQDFQANGNETLKDIRKGVICKLCTFALVALNVPTLFACRSHAT
jgi:hypothetical protein